MSYDKFYVREAEEYDVENGLLVLSGSTDVFDVKRNLYTMTSSYFYPKSLVFVLVEKQTGNIMGKINLIIEKKLDGTRSAHIDHLSSPDIKFSYELIKYAKNVAVQDGCVSIEATCDDKDVDGFRMNDFQMSEKFHATL